MRSLPLHAAHEGLGAFFREFQGWEIPSCYSGAEGECALLSESAAVSDLGFLGKILFKGEDRRKFLNGLLTNDIASLEALSGFPCCVLTPKGKLRADFTFYDLGEGFLAVVFPSAAPNLLEAVGKLIVLSRSSMEDATRLRGLFHVAGPKSGHLLKSVFGRLEALKPYQVEPAEWQGARSFVMSFPRLRSDGALVLCPAEASEGLWTALLEAAEPLGGGPAGWEALDIARVESGLPLFGVDMDEDTIPLEARLDEAISFTKGCYMGQETISRVKNLGHLNRVLTRLKVEGSEPPTPGTPVSFAGKDVGKVTSAAWSPGLRSALALAMLRVEACRAGTKLELGGGGRSFQAEVVVNG